MSGLGDMGNLLKQAQEMQRQVDRVRQELREAIVEGASSDGSVRVQLTSDRHEVKAVQVDSDSLDGQDLTERIQAAMQDALSRAHEAERAAIDKVTGGMQLPGLF